VKSRTLEDLDVLQEEMFGWCRRNFPMAGSTQEFMGLVEEVGELSHAHLKNLQGIRDLQDDEVATEAKVDAVGDILIYLFNYCSFEGINVANALDRTWRKVSQRDWIADPNATAHAES
jgi:NTP pyrophosphatase (non-canonical NTP hydrolase)